MKSIATKHDPKEGYPYLGIANDTVVLFTSIHKGTIVHTKDPTIYGKIGDHIDGLFEEEFVFYTGRVELSNT